MRMGLPVCLAGAAVLLLAGCVSRPPAGPVAVTLGGPALAAAHAQVRQREAAVADAGRLVFSGRVALSNGRDGGSGRIEWQQQGEAFDVVLSAPVSRQGWRLTGDPGGGTIEGLEGGPRTSQDLDGLLLEATGMEIPVAALAAWAAGTPADAQAFGPARLDFRADGALARLGQGGWTVDYLRWEPGPGALPMPVRINAVRGQARVRLVVDRWALEPASAGTD